MTGLPDAPVILFVAPSGFPLGGVADWLDCLLPGLRDAGARCILGLVAGPHHDAQAYLRRHPWSEAMIISCPTGSQEGRVSAIARAIQNSAPDLLIVINIVDAYEAIRRLRILGLPCPRMLTALHALQRDLLLDVAAERDVIDAVVATNRLSEQLARDSIGDPRRACYAAYGVPLHGATAMHKCGGDGCIELLYVGRLEESQKRVSDLPRLLHLARSLGLDVRLSIAGGGPDESALRRQFLQAELEGFVSFLGVLGPVELADAYRHHDALIVTSVWETGPIVVLEAMSQALPVISSRYVGSGLEGALANGENCLLFGIGDVPAAVDAIVRLSAPGVRSKLIEGGRALIRARYSRDQFVKSWIEVIRYVLALPVLPVPSNRKARPPNGRLDRLLGPRKAEVLRAALGLRYAHTEPGGTWPHTRHRPGDDQDWLAEIAKLDHASPQELT